VVVVGPVKSELKDGLITKTYLPVRSAMLNIVKRLERSIEDFRADEKEQTEKGHLKAANAYKDCADRLQQILRVETQVVNPPATVTKEAHDVIHGERLKHYGHPSVNFQRIATAWSEYLGNKLPDDVVISPSDVTNMMILLKVMRMAEGYHRDSVVDIVGYAALTAIVEGDDKL
jgi:hypothetical protein